MITIKMALIYLQVLSGLYVFDRAFNLVKAYRKSERFTQKRYQRVFTFLSVALLITSLFI